MLTHLEDRSALGPNIAATLISMSYSGILHGIIILPLAVKSLSLKALDVQTSEIAAMEREYY
jgi:flagellar motor component MotA